jgi:hypothetical protein
MYEVGCWSCVCVCVAIYTLRASAWHYQLQSNPILNRSNISSQMFSIGPKPGWEQKMSRLRIKSQHRIKIAHSTSSDNATPKADRPWSSVNEPYCQARDGTTCALGNIFNANLHKYESNTRVCLAATKHLSFYVGHTRPFNKSGI